MVASLRASAAMAPGGMNGVHRSNGRMPSARQRGVSAVARCEAVTLSVEFSAGALVAAFAVGYVAGSYLGFAQLWYILGGLLLVTASIFFMPQIMNVSSIRLNSETLPRPRTTYRRSTCSYYEDLRFRKIRKRFDYDKSPAENALKLLRYVHSAAFSEELKICITYCMDVLEKNSDELYVPQVLLEPVDGIDCSPVEDVDCSVHEWLLSQFTRSRSSFSLEQSQKARLSLGTSPERRRCSAPIDATMVKALAIFKDDNSCKADTDRLLEAASKESDTDTAKVSETSVTSEKSMGITDRCNGFHTLMPTHDSPDGDRPPKTFGYGVLFSAQAPIQLESASSDHRFPFETSPEESDAILACLEGIARWDWDIFKLREASNGREMQVLGWHILRFWEMDQKFGIEACVLQKWLCFVESSYASCQYHNSTHAADVLQTVHFMLSTLKASEYLGDHEILALLIGAMVHDIGHDGFTNSFHKHRLTDKALLYNDQSIQENFHIGMLFDQLAVNPEINIFRSLSATQFTEIRRMLILLILSTDMSKHFHLLQDVRGILEKHGRDPKGWTLSDPFMCFVLHICDIASQAKPKELALNWAARIFAEFFLQGDCEKELGLPVSPQCDRATTIISSAEIGFIKFIVRPTFDILVQLLPRAAELCMPDLEANYAYWMRREDTTIRLKTAAVRQGAGSVSRRRATVNVAATALSPKRSGSNGDLRSAAAGGDGIGSGSGEWVPAIAPELTRDLPPRKPRSKMKRSSIV